MTPIQISGEFIGSRFEAVNLGGMTALAEIGSAEIEQDGQHWHVTAAVLDLDGYLSRWTLPDSYTTEWEAQQLANALNEPNESKTL